MSEYDEQLKAMEGYASRAPTAPQGSIAWLMEKVGHVGCSRLNDVQDFLKSGKPGAKREKLKIEVLVERLVGKPTEHFVNDAMRHGIETEPLARMRYEEETGEMVEQVGFLHSKTIKWFGGSPDGLIGDDGGVEFKCPQPAEHIRILLTHDIEDYQAQCRGLMLVTGRKWWDLMSYCPMLPETIQVYRIRIYRNEEELAALEAAIVQFLAEVADLEARLRALAK